MCNLFLICFRSFLRVGYAVEHCIPLFMCLLILLTHVHLPMVFGLSVNYRLMHGLCLQLLRNSCIQGDNF